MKQHGKSGSGAWMSWKNMLDRCYYKGDKCFPRYGGRGIKVCDRWHVFTNFFSDMGDRPKGTRLERIDNDGDYCLKNCKWATHKEQARNRSSNTVFTVNGVTGCLTELAERFGISPYTVSNRITALGMSPQEAILKPVRFITKGKRLSKKEVSQIRKLSKSKKVQKIADQFGVTYMAIRKIILGENHKSH